MSIRQGVTITKEAAGALGTAARVEAMAIPEVEGQGVVGMYVMCPSCKVVSRVMVDTDQPAWCYCPAPTCHAMFRP